MVVSGGKFLILGGGIAGLSAAYRLLGKVADPKNITVLESSGRLGGWIQSKRFEDGAIFELGPRGLRPAGPNGRASLELVSLILFVLDICCASWLVSDIVCADIPPPIPSKPWAYDDFQRLLSLLKLWWG